MNSAGCGREAMPRRALEMACAVAERGDDQLAGGWAGGRYTGAHWVIDLQASGWASR